MSRSELVSPFRNIFRREPLPASYKSGVRATHSALISAAPAAFRAIAASLSVAPVVITSSISHILLPLAFSEAKKAPARFLRLSAAFKLSCGTPGLIRLNIDTSTFIPAIFPMARAISWA